MLPSIKKKF